MANTVHPVDVAKPLLSDQVRAAVAACGLSHAEICRRIDIDQSALSRFVTGERGLSMEVLDRLGRLLDFKLRPVKPLERAKRG